MRAEVVVKVNSMNKCIIRLEISYLELCLALGLSALPVHAEAQLILDNYARVGPSETLAVPFTASGGISTSYGYSGSVELIVSGTGFSYGLNGNDAFYCSESIDYRCTATGVVLDPQYYILNIGFTGLPFAGGEANNIDQFISYIESVGPTAAPTIPSYDAVGHTYHFVISLPTAISNPLFFGVSDGIYGDNGGEYQISVFQLIPSTVPEPESFFLMLSGLGLVGLVARSSTKGGRRG
jgi:hypothetical protein